MLAVDRYIVPRIGGVPLQKLTSPMLNGLYAELERSGRRKGKGLSPRASAMSTRSCGGLSPTPSRGTSFAERRRRGQAAAEGAADDHDMERRAARVVPGERPRRSSLRGVDCLCADGDAARRGPRPTLDGSRPGRWQGEDRPRFILVDYVPTISEPKTERGRRTIALNPATVAALRAHQAGQAVEAAMAGDAWENTDGYVFTDELGRVIHPQSFTDRFKRYAKAARLPAIRLHELRHSHATLALEAGVAPKVVSDRLGHATTSFTMDVYADALPAVEETAAAMVAALVLGDDG